MGIERETREGLRPSLIFYMSLFFIWGKLCYTKSRLYIRRWMDFGKKKKQTNSESLETLKPLGPRFIFNDGSGLWSRHYSF